MSTNSLGPIAFITYTRRSRKDKFGIHIRTDNEHMSFLMLEQTIQYKLYSINGKVVDNMDQNAVIKLCQKKAKTVKLGVYALSATPPEEQKATLKIEDETTPGNKKVAEQASPPAYMQKGVTVHSAPNTTYPLHVVEYPGGSVTTYAHSAYNVTEW